MSSLELLKASASKFKQVKERDQATRNSLNTGTKIKFSLISTSKTMSYYEEDSLLSYDKFIENDHQIDGLHLTDPDDVVLDSSYCNILFLHPIINEDTIFRVTCRDELKGFTRSELALYVMQRYHLLVYLYQNYDINKGKIVSGDELSVRKKVLYKPFMYEEDWTDNGVKSLQYNKDTDQWKVILNSYA